MKRKMIFVLIFVILLVTLSGCNFFSSFGKPEPAESELVIKQKEIYQLALNVGYSGSFEEWLESITGEQGIPGLDGKSIDLTVEDGFIKWRNEGDNTWYNLVSLELLKGSKGEDGKSAYEIYKEYFPEYDKSEEEWINDLINGKLSTKKDTNLTNLDLGGYRIRIAQSAPTLGQTDPFHPDYQGTDKIAKQQAWTWVEENYNCKIEVVAYPDDAEWGAPRWNYILAQAANETADYDFYTIPDTKISAFVEGNALIDITSWYNLYGNSYMEQIYYDSGSYKGKLYSITDNKSSIYNVMYYNIGLFEKLGMDKSPAEIFNDGDWTYTVFLNYALEAQAKLDALADASASNKYWAVAGCSPYYWVGMTNAGGEKIANTSTMTFELLTPTAISAADTLKAIYAGGAMSPDKQFDQNVISWMEGRALFNTGDLWFVNAENRWRADQWSPNNPDGTSYGFVPFPRPDNITKENQKLGVPGTVTWVMPHGRNYNGYGSDCTAENIYRAIVKTFELTKEYRVNAPGYDAEGLLDTFARKYTEDEASVEAFKYIASRTNVISIYEPISEPGNAILNTGYSSFSSAFHNYIIGIGGYSSLADALEPLLQSLQAALENAFQ